MAASKFLGVLTKDQDISGFLNSFVFWLSVRTFSYYIGHTLTIKLLEVFWLSLPHLHHPQQLGKCSTSPRAEERGGPGRFTCLDVAHDMSCLGKVAPGSTVSDSQLLPGPGTRAKEDGAEGFPGNQPASQALASPGHPPPQSRLYNWEI